jgi:hypothetical protein
MIMIRLKGGLGNQMFQYATARALAEKHKTNVSFDLTLLKDRGAGPHAVFRDFELGPYKIEQKFASENEIRKFNPVPTGFFQRLRLRIKKVFSPLRTYIELSHVYDPAVMMLPDDFCLVGAFQSEKYFLGIRPALLKAFELTSRSPVCLKMVSEITSKNAVCLHIRRGDYVTNKLYNKLLGVQPVSYYESGLARIASTEKDLHVFVFSDDISWCRDNLKFAFPTTFISEENAGSSSHEHVHLMSKCKHFVLANSSFSWWGAWLSEHTNKLVIAPKVWFADGSLDAKDIVPEKWITI